MSPRRLASALALLLSLLLVACSDDGPTEPPGSEDAGPATIQGAVTAEREDGGSEGVEAAKVELSGAATSDTFTDVDGSYAFTGLEPGSYTVAVTLPAGVEAEGTLEASTELGEGETATLDFVAAAIEQVAEEVESGTVDTLSIASGASVEVDASSASSAVQVEIETSAPTTESALASFRLRMGPATSTASSLRANRASGGADLASGPEITVTLVQAVVDEVNYAFSTRRYNTRRTPLFTRAETGLWIDPATDLERLVARRSVDIPEDASLDAQIELMETDAGCPDRFRDFFEMRDEPRNGRIALVLIHGWQLTRISCESFRTFDPANQRWNEFGQTVEADPALAERYKLYALKYPTLDRVGIASNFLADELADREIERAVLVGHSMGGLVARGVLETDAADRVDGIITLGTPHRGSPLATLGGEPLEQWKDVLPEERIEDIWGDLLLMDGSLFLTTDGARDLTPASELIQGMIEDSPEHADQVFPFAGDLLSEEASPAIELPIYETTGLLMKNVFGVSPSDGIVGVESALGGARGEAEALYPVNVFEDHFKVVHEGYNHAEMLSGQKDGTLFPEATKALELLTRHRDGLVSATGITDGEPADIWVLRPDGTGARKIADHPTRAETPGRWWEGNRPVAYTVEDTDGGPTDLWIVQSDGTGKMALDDRADWQYDPNLSPNASDVAYTHQARDSTDSLEDLAVKVLPATGGSPTRLTSQLSHQPTWGPDGQRVALAYWDGSGSWQLATVNRDGSGFADLVEESTGKGVADPDWSPSDSRIAYESDRSGKGEIWIVDAAAGPGTEQQVTVEPAGHSAANPHVSPDGSRIAYQVWDGAQWDVAVIDSDGTNRRQLTNDPADDFVYAWGPDGSALVLATNRRTGSEELIDLYIANLTTDDPPEPVTVTTPGGREVTPMVPREAIEEIRWHEAENRLRPLKSPR